MLHRLLRNRIGRQAFQLPASICFVQTGEIDRVSSRAPGIFEKAAVLLPRCQLLLPVARYDVNGTYLRYLWNTVLPEIHKTCANILAERYARTSTYSMLHDAYCTAPACRFSSIHAHTAIDCPRNRPSTSRAYYVTCIFTPAACVTPISALE